MSFKPLSSPFSERPNHVSIEMLWVLLALLPGIIAMTWYFGWGTVIHIIIAIFFAVATEALVLKIRHRPIAPALKDLSAVVTAVLFAIAIPPLLSLNLTLIGIIFAIVIVKQLYGGLGYNTFNPAMAAYVFLLISFPTDMTFWLAPDLLNPATLSFKDTLLTIFNGQPPQNITWDAITQATPLDIMRTQLDLNRTISEISNNPLWGDYGARGWEWVSNWFLIGGLLLLYKRIISWHIPFSMLTGLLFISMFFHLLDQDAYPFALFHLFSGAIIIGAFFIATDPVTACTTKKGQIIFGASIGILIYIIRTWGSYPDGVAFAVLIMNMAAPMIDYYTRPRVYGHET